MKITALKAYDFAGPLGDLCFVKVETEDPSIYGWGEASLPSKCRAVAQAVRDLQPLLIGMSALDVERCWQRAYRHSYWRGGPILTSSISGIDMALWDIRGKAFNKPIFELLGGPVRDRILLYANIGLSNNPRELAERANKATAQGYDIVKFYPLSALALLEFPAAIDAVVRCCEAVRGAIGPKRTFALDFHGRCSPAVAAEIEAAVRHTRPMWIEEPVPPENTPGLERCTEKFLTPIGVGERLFTRWGFREIFEKGLAAIVQPDAANAGGISECWRIGAMAELYGVAFAPHNPNGPVQCQASLHLAAAVPSFTLLEHRFDLVEAFSQFVSHSPSSTGDGYADLPTGPGLGIEVDEDFVASKPSSPVVLESFRADGSVGDW